MKESTVARVTDANVERVAATVDSVGLEGCASVDNLAAEKGVPAVTSGVLPCGGTVDTPGSLAGAPVVVLDPAVVAVG